MQKRYSSWKKEDTKTLVGKIYFSERRITIESGEESYYVHPPRARGFIHGDLVAFSKSRPVKDGKMAEAKPERLMKRSEEEVIVEASLSKKGTKWSLLPVFGSILIEVTGNPRVEEGDLYIGKFVSGRKVELIRKFGNMNDVNILENLILFQAGVRTKWPSDVEGYIPERPKIERLIGSRNSSDEYLGTQWGSGENTVGARGEQENDGQSGRVYSPPRLLDTFGHKSIIEITVGVKADSSVHSEGQSAGLLRTPGGPFSSIHLDSPFPSQGRNNSEFGFTPLPQSLSLKDSIFANIRVNGKIRIDFRSWYTMTIDGADAKDLDDAISIARYEGGDTLLGVHIADVAEYVREHTPLDREAYMRGTSIYTPGRVIPMLPESLSNDLCSLHPGEPKLVLSILMRIDKQGYVKESFVTEGLIDSQHRGVYEEIGKEMKNTTSQKVDVPSFGASRRIQEPGNLDPSLHSGGRSTGSIPLSQGRDARFLHTQEGQTFVPSEILSNFSSLYQTLSERRKKEGKIIFETTECYFDLDDERKVQNIRKRERGDAHMMIEEFMVLANEEVAKWCVKRKIPFLSRVHDAPSAEKTREIHDVILANVSDAGSLNLIPGGDIEPHHIRSILEHAKSDSELYLFSRLLLPKMAKAIYREKPVRHFGLALTHYAHFTSPIRRYPDLLLHRMVKKYLHRESEVRKEYEKNMKKWGESLSKKERNAEDVSRSIDDLFMCRYMEDKVGKTFEGIISGVTESNVYVELENGVEGSIYLARKAPLIRSFETLKSPQTLEEGEDAKHQGGFGSQKLTLDLARGSLRASDGKEVYRIGEKISVKIESVDVKTRRIEMILD